MGSVGVVVDTSVEDGGGVLADSGVDESLATGVVLDELANVVDDTSDSDPGLAVLGLLDEVVPADNGEVLEGNAPVKGSALLVELLLLLLETALLDLVVGELLEVVGETELLPHPDAPLGRVILPPLNSVTEIAGELVVEVVVTLTKGDESSDDVVPGRVAVVEGLVAEPVGKRVDAEGSLLDEEDTEDTAVDEATSIVTPAETANKGRDDEGHGDDALDVVLVLENDDGVLVEIGDVGTADSLGVLLHDHPANVGVEETLADRIGVLVSIGVTVVSTVIPGPPAGGTLNGGGTTGGEPDLERERGLVRGVSPKSVVAGS